MLEIAMAIGRHRGKKRDETPTFRVLTRLSFDGSATGGIFGGIPRLGTTPSNIVEDAGGFGSKWSNSACC